MKKHKSKLSKYPKKSIGGDTVEKKNYDSNGYDLARYDFNDEGIRNQEDVMKTSSTINGVANGVMGAWNPLMGALTTLSSTGGTAIEEAAMKRNSKTGKVEKTNTGLQILSGVLNPFLALSKRLSYEGGMGDLSGEGYVDHINKNVGYRVKPGYDESALRAFNTTGKGANFYNAKGGLINPAYEVEKDEVILKHPYEKVKLEKGGQQLSSTAVLVGGDKHSQGGNDGKGGQFVISDQIPYGKGSVADAVTKANILKGKGEKKLAGFKSKLSKDTANRMIANADADTARAITYQEQYKLIHGLDNSGKKAKGGYIPKYENGSEWADIVPYALEGVNMILNSNRAKIPKPVYTKPEQLRTEFDITGGLAAVNEGLGIMDRYVNANTSNSVNARISNSENQVKGIGLKNTLYNEKTNQENNLVNQNLLNTQSINEKNNALTMGYRESQRLRKEAQLGEYSASLGNIASTYSTQRRQKQEDANQAAYDDKAFRYLQQRDKTGAFTEKNIDTPEMQKLIDSNPAMLQESYTSAVNNGYSMLAAKLRAEAIKRGITLK